MEKAVPNPTTSKDPYPTEAAARFAAEAGIAELGVPHLAEYFGPWAILPEPFEAACAQLETIRLVEHVRSTQAAIEGGLNLPYEVTYDGTAIIPIQGPLMKYVSSLSGGSSTVVIRRQIDLAAADSEVRRIVLAIDSPGGTVAGTYALAQTVKEANAQKPVDAVIEDLGASAAYWVASQARKVWLATPTTGSGAIGTYAVIRDWSARAAQMGLKVHVIRAGQFKGAGEAGTEVTAEQLAEWQARVDQLNDFFVRGVASGRRMTLARARELADGRLYIGEDAVKAGLADGVKTLAAVLAEGKPRNSGGKAMSQEKQEAAVALTVADIRAICEGADDAFIVAQLSAGADRDAVQKAWQGELLKRQAELRKQIETQKQELAEARAKREEKQPEQHGVEPVGEGGDQGYEGDAVADYDAAVREKVATGLSRQAACLAVARQRPDLHEANLLAHPKNQGSKTQALIRERFEM